MKEELESFLEIAGELSVKGMTKQVRVFLIVALSERDPGFIGF